VPIRIRLALLFALGTAILIGAGGAVFVSRLTASLRGSLAATLAVRATADARRVPDLGDAGDDPSGDSRPAGRGAAVTPIQRAARPARQCLPAGQVADGGAVGQLIGPSGAPLPVGGQCTGVLLLTPEQLAAARRGPLVTTARLGATGPQALIYARPAADHGGIVVVEAASLATVNAAASEVRTALLAGGPAAVILAGLAAALVAGAALAPVTRMRRQADLISARDADSALSVPRTRDEIAALAGTLNALLARLQGALSQQRGFVAAAGHELRTPLAALRAELELAGQPGRSRGDLAAAVRDALADTDRIIQLAENLLLLARSDDRRVIAAVRAIRVADVLEPCAASFAALAAQRGVTIGTEVPDGLVASLDELRFRQVADNLIANALRASPAGSRVRVTARREGGAVVIEVTDQGPGFPEDFLPRAFDRFSRPDDSRSSRDGGAGLGLAIVRALVEAHHGSVSVGNRPEGGAVARIVLPAVAADAAGQRRQDVRSHTAVSSRANLRGASSG